MLTDLQIEERKTGIGASESAAIVGLHPYMSAYKLWMIKTGKLIEDLSDNDNIWWGTHLEAVIADRYAYETDQVLLSDPQTFRSKTCNYMIAHPDRFIEGTKKLVEIKTAWYSPESWGESGSDQIPHQYVIQCQHQLACVGDEYDEVDLVVFFKNICKISVYTVKRNANLIKDIEAAVTRFWLEHVQAEIAPALMSADDCKLAFPKNTIDDCIEATPFELNVLKSYKAADASINELEDIKENCKKQLFEVIGERSGIKEGDRILCTWKANKNGRRDFRPGKNI